jgi:hypothetical protein
MQLPKLTKDKHEMIVRKVTWGRLIMGFPMICFIAAFVFYQGKIKMFLADNLLAALGLAVAVLAALYFLIRDSLKEKVVLVVNIHGIWIRKKGLITWSNLRYYYFEVADDENETTYLKIGLHDSDKQIKISMSMFDTNEQLIDEAILRNSGEYNIIALKDNY